MDAIESATRGVDRRNGDGAERIPPGPGVDQNPPAMVPNGLGNSGRGSLLTIGPDGAHGIDCSPDRNPIYAAWLAQRISHFQTQGVQTLALWHKGQIAAVVGFCNPHYNRVEACWACDNPRAVTRGAILTMLGTAFLPPWSFMGIAATAEKRNKRARKFMEGIGFKQEGVLRKVTPEGRSLIAYSLLRDEFMTLIERYRGGEHREVFGRLMNERR